MFLFEFTSTHADLLDADSVLRTARTGRRPWARALLAVVGFYFLMLFCWVVAGHQRYWWQPPVSLLLGATLTWKFVAQPVIERRRIRRTPSALSVELEFAEGGATVSAGGIRQFQYGWQALRGMSKNRKGILLGFEKGAALWVPHRVFKTADERAAFVRYVRSQAHGKLTET